MTSLESKLRLQRNILIGGVVSMLAVNGLLAAKVYNQQEIIVLVPTLDRELKIGSSFVSDEYLRLRAEQLVYLLFSMKNGNVEYVTRELLRQVDNSTHSEFKIQIDKLAQDINSRNYRYWFSDITQIDIDNEALTVSLKGYLETYFADKQIDKQFKEYQLSFINRSGILNLETFTEVKNETNN